MEALLKSRRSALNDTYASSATSMQSPPITSVPGCRLALNPSGVLDDYCTITTSKGSVVGVKQFFGNSYLFAGIPYANPIESPLELPVPSDPWGPDQVLDCTSYGHACPQRITAKVSDLPENCDIGELGVDCLNLNVLAPTTALLLNTNDSIDDSEKEEDQENRIPGPPLTKRASSTSKVSGALRPVLVWIHGGGNSTGSNKGGFAGFSPTACDAFAKRGNASL